MYMPGMMKSQLFVPPATQHSSAPGQTEEERLPDCNCTCLCNTIHGRYLGAEASWLRIQSGKSYRSYAIGPAFLAFPGTWVSLDV